MVNVRPLIKKVEYISVGERDRQGLFGESPCTQRLRLACQSAFHCNIYIGTVQVRPPIKKVEYISVAERARQGLFGESPCTQRLRLACRVATRLPALSTSARRVV